MKMKASLFVLSFLFFAFSVGPFSATAQTGTVLDTSGNTVLTGVNYYILPVSPGSGLGMGQPRNATCPLDVVQVDLDPSEKGLPLRFSPWTGKTGAIPVSTDLNIEFKAETTCIQPTLWRLGGYNVEVGQWFVSTAGWPEGKPGKETINNWFKIEKLDSGYKIVYCPTVCSVCKVLCKDVGIYVDGDMRRLALSDVPFIVKLEKGASI